MDIAKIFINGRSQAVRLPKAYRFDEDEVVITKINDMVILFPRRKGWELMARAIEGFTDDYMADRGQPKKPETRRAV